MALDPNRYVSIFSGSSSVDINELCAIRTLVMHEENLSIGPTRLVPNAALTEADLASLFTPETTARLIFTISAATSTPDSLESNVGNLR